MVKFSIIVPIYSVEKYLPICIDSILNQSETNWELLLVNDGSIDNSGDICDAYAKKDARIKVIHKKNEGVSIARNIGIDVASGKWIVFVDSDDFLLPSHLEDFKIDLYQDVDLIVQGLEYYDQRSESFFSPIRFSNNLITDNNLKEEIKKNKLLKSGYPVAKAYKTELLKKKGIVFDTRISYHEDHIFVLNYLNECHKILLSDSLSYKYRYFHSHTTLSYKRHPWQNMDISGTELINCLNKMEQRFLDKGSETYKECYTYAYQCKIIAAQELRASNTYYTRKLYFSKIIDSTELNQYYYPKCMKGKITKFFFKYTAYPFIDLYLWLILVYKKF